MIALTERSEYSQVYKIGKNKRCKNNKVWLDNVYVKYHKNAETNKKKHKFT